MRAFLLACALLTPAAHAVTCTTTSGAKRNSLLELYTSEGCSSCPPADRWLSQLPENDGVVPLAFHVDYWDRLGWQDPYAQAAFSQRQRSRNSGLGWVYTPQVMLDGRDLRIWHRGLPKADAVPARLVLDLALSAVPRHLDVTVTPHFLATEARSGAQLYLALTESRLESRVTAGENARRTLRHDHVVRELVGPLPASVQRYRFTPAPEWKRADLTVTAFVLDADGATLQALAAGCN